jgi:DNA-directed RNA polymerase subunit M/transcription elongation factor TFIIS
MNKTARLIVLFLGVVAAIIIIYKLVSAQHRVLAEKEQVKAYKEGLVAQEVWCESCDTTSPLEVMFKDKARFQVCPKCGEKAARPIVYYMCMNEGCNKQLVKVRNHVMEGTEFLKSPDAFVCPNCGQASTLYFEPLHLDKARQVAEETGQPFP